MNLAATGSSRPLVMIAGVGPGAGKTTLMDALLSALPAEGLPCQALTEDDVWGARQLGVAPVDRRTARPEFARLLDPATPASERSSRLVEAFSSFAAAARAANALWVQDWVWSDLARACIDDDADPTAADVTTQLVQLAAESGLRGTVLFLDLDATVAMQRAVAARGAVWFNRHVRADVETPIGADRIAEAADGYATTAVRRRRELAADGWEVVDVRADGPIEEVLAVSLAVLNRSR